MNINVARTPDAIEAASQRLSSAGVLGCDTETSALHPRFGKLYSIQFSDGDFNLLVPLSEGISVGALSGLLADPAIVKVFHNARFDLEFLTAAGVEVNNIFDTMIAEKVLTKGAKQSASLAETLYRYFAVDLDKSQRKTFGRGWDGVWSDDLVNYALSDVVHLPRLMREQTDWLEKIGLTEEFATHMAKIVSLNS
ncbi:MAG: ribonuclease D [Acidobacteriota bacterium]